MVPVAKYLAIPVEEEVVVLRVPAVMRQVQPPVLLEALAVRLVEVLRLAVVRPLTVQGLALEEVLMVLLEEEGVRRLAVVVGARLAAESRWVVLDSTAVQRVLPCAAIINSSQEELQQQPAIPAQALRQVPSLITSVVQVVVLARLVQEVPAEQAVPTVVAAAAAVLLSAATVALAALAVQAIAV